MTKPDAKPAAAEKSGSTLEKILARKRAEGGEPEELRAEEAAPTRKAVVKAAAPSAAAKPTSASKAPAKPATKTAEPSRSRKSRGSEDDDDDERGDRRRGAAKKSSNGLLFATVGAVVLAGGAIGAIFALGDKEEPKTPPPPVVAAVEESSKPAPVAESAPVEAPANETGAAKEAAAKIEEAPKEPEKPTAKRKFDVATRDALKDVDAPKPSSALEEILAVLDEGILPGSRRAEAAQVFAAEPRAAFGALHNRLVKLTREKFTAQVSVEGRSEIEAAAETFYRFSEQLLGVSGYRFTEQEEKRMGSIRTAVAGYDPETEAVKILDELVRLQNACMAQLARWGELWSEKKLSTKEGWNDFIDANGRGARDES
ncbi:MAG: hypothetical protein JNM84_16515 [Planctomycetes bacterium]|nr:hypothetical protein [Planctomycetota bacterium]